MTLVRRIVNAGALLGVAAACLAGASPAAAACPSQDNLAYDSGGRATATAPNDPLYPDQWAHEQINVPGAWARGAAGAGVVVAVVDTGVDYRHPDLSGQLLPGHDLTDDQCSAGAQDETGHGTHVAGIVAALANNGIGVAGVAPGAKILPVRVLDSGGYATTKQMTDGLRWAADNGADVINLSIGEVLGDALVENADWNAAVEHAWSRGAVVVAAAGNEPVPFCETPSNAPRAICVAATDSLGFPSWYSTFPNSPNEGVQVRAPGGMGGVTCGDDVWSTVWPGTPDDTRDDGCGFRGYEPFAGTSMAAPHVAAVAAMLAGGGLSNAQIMDCIKRTSTNGGDYDPVYGYGIVDAQAAAAGCGADFSRTSGPDGSAPTPGGGSAPAPAPGSGVAGERAASRDTTGPRVRLALARATRASVSRAGTIPVRIRSSEPARISIRIVSGRLAAAAGTNATLIARGTVKVTRAGLTTARLKLTRAGRKMLRMRKSRTVSLIGNARDAAGNTGTAASQGRLR